MSTFSDPIDIVSAAAGDALIRTKTDNDTVSATITRTNAEAIAGVTAGTAAAGKAVVLDSNSKIDVLDITTLKKGGTTIAATAAELDKLASVTAGTVAASKAVVVDANKKVDVWDPTTLKINGTTVGATAAEIDAVADISASGGATKIKKIALAATAGTETDSTWDIPAKAVILDVWVDVTTAESTGATKTLDVGLLASESGGDADGLLDGISTAATGIKKGIATWTTGANEVYAASTTRGVLLQSFQAGADVSLDVGHVTDSPHLSTAVTAKSISYTAGSAQTEFVGVLYILYTELG